MESTLISELPGIISVSLIFGGVIIIAVTKILSDNWRAARCADQEAVLKKTMIDRGYSVEDIMQVLNTASHPAAKIEGKAT